MSCVKNISRAFFLTIVIVGFMSMFHQNFKSHNVNKYEQSPKETMVKKTKKVGDFSKIDNSFEVQKTGGMLGYNVVLAQHKPSGQKMVVVDTGKNKVITQDDVKSENAEERILKKISKIKYQSVSLDEFHVTEHGTIDSFGQKDVPYVKFDAKIKNPSVRVRGIISVVKDDKGKEKILVSANYKDSYSQEVSEDFFSEIKP